MNFSILGEPPKFNVKALGTRGGLFAELNHSKQDEPLLTGLSSIEETSTSVLESDVPRVVKADAWDHLKYDAETLVLEDFITRMKGRQNTTQFHPSPFTPAGRLFLFGYGPMIISNVLNQMKTSVHQDINKKQKCGQFVFVIDGTASMQPFMDSLKALIGDLLADLTQRFPIGYTITFIIYRDRDDPDSKTSDTIEFQGLEIPNYQTHNASQTQVLKNYMDSNFRADGGDDYPKWLNLGLAKAIKQTQWDKRTAVKMIMVFTDSPNHGSKNYIEGMLDKYPEGLNSSGQPDENQAEICSLLSHIATHKSMYLSLFKLNPDIVAKVPPRETDHLQQMYDNWMSCLDKQQGVQKSDKGRFTTVNVPYGAETSSFLPPGELLKHVSKSISASVSRSLSASTSHHKFLISDVVFAKIDELAYLYGAKWQAIAWVLEKLGLSDEIIDTCKEEGIHDRSIFNDAALERMGVNPRLRSDFTRLLKQFLTKMEEEEEAARLKAAESKKGGRRWSRLNVAKRDSKYRANKKSIAKKFKKCISRKLRLNRKV